MMEDLIMEWQPPESKLLASSAYDAGKHILYLRFLSGDVYRYFEFPEEQYREFLDAESHGRYFLNYIRNHFRYERLARLQAA
jgi:KTSC domain